MSSPMKEGMGVHNFWGLTPAKDIILTEPYVPQKESISVLILQPGDCGHILKTIACRRRHPNVSSVSLYVYEKEPEALARLLLLLYISQSFENHGSSSTTKTNKYSLKNNVPLQDRTVPLRQRVNTFLEVYGNAVIQERTAIYVEHVGKALIEIVNDGDKQGCLGNFVDFTYLKYKEKDMLEAVFKSWSLHQPCDIVSLRDLRLRSMLGTRYDTRDACADWDYQWRRSGIAFEFGDQVYNHPNRSMVSFAEGVTGSRAGITCGFKKEVMGFWLDIRCGPYFTFGVECDEHSSDDAKELFKIVNKGTGSEQNRHHTVDVSVYNVLSMLWEQETANQYHMTLPHDVYSGIGETTATLVDGGNVVECQQEISNGKSSSNNNNNAEVVVVPASKEDESRLLRELAVPPPCSLKIHLLCGDWNSDHCGKSKLKDKAFDSVVVSGASAHLLDGASGNAMCKMIADSALLRVDTAKYIVPLEKEAKEKWNSHVIDMTKACGWENVEQVHHQLQESENTTASTSINELLFLRKKKIIPNS